MRTQEFSNSGDFELGSGDLLFEDDVEKIENNEDGSGNFGNCFRV